MRRSAYGGQPAFGDCILDDRFAPIAEIDEPLDRLRLLMPTDWEAFLKTRTEFARDWDKYTGLR